MADTVSVTPEAVAAAIKATEYKYFGDYEMSDDQRAAVDTLVAVAKMYFPSTQPAPAFPREELDHGIERVCEAISLEFKGFWAAEDLVEELPALIRREFSALLQGKQP